jgi:biotin operon repressor
MDSFLYALKTNYAYPLYVKSHKIESGLSISGSEVRAIVRTLRRGGFLIISSSKGYSFTENEDIFRETTLTHLNDRAKSLHKTIADCERAMALRDENQMAFFPIGKDKYKHFSGFMGGV